MIGAIAGDIVGSVYEGSGLKSKRFALLGPGSRFTDDSVLTVAVARAIMENLDYRTAVLELGRKYPDAGYSPQFRAWLSAPAPQPYQSFGNGAAMRASPVGFAFDTEEAVLREAGKTAEISHDHPKGIMGAQATALAVFLARTGASKQSIRTELAGRFKYDLQRSVDQIRPAYRFDLSCEGTVPQAVTCFLDAQSYEDALRNAVSLGGDSDTLACIAGAIAHAFYGEVPVHIVSSVREILAPELWSITERFCARFGISLCACEARR
ncbi:MAG TPA: ADP-ribosylglycohydrolase family protein [Burkholderiales bacterium]|nr:ADP-ribosylglycohydrolase family protein [Burkholderiales bacterium]